MDNVMLDKIKELISKNETIGIAVGKNPGLDEMGGALSLYLALKQAGKNVTVACPTEPLVEISSLVGIDTVKKAFGGNSGGDLTVSFPYKEGEIEKISYTLEDGKLNILVKAGENGLVFNEKDIEYKRGGSAPGLIFVVGTPRISDLGSVFDPEALKDSKIINIDYKPENQGFGDIPLLGRNSSSVSELVASFLNSLDFKINVDIASNLLSGIIAVTDNFQKENVAPLSFEMAAMLLKKGGVRQKPEKKSEEIETDSFFSPASNAASAKSDFDSAKSPSFEKASIGTAETKPEVKINEDNPPDDWLAPKIYKGSTNV